MNNHPPLTDETAWGFMWCQGAESLPLSLINPPPYRLVISTVNLGLQLQVHGPTFTTAIGEQLAQKEVIGRLTLLVVCDTAFFIPIQAKRQLLQQLVSTVGEHRYTLIEWPDPLYPQLKREILESDHPLLAAPQFDMTVILIQ